MKNLLIIFSVCFSVTLSAFSQEALYQVKNYSVKEYGKDFHPTNLSLTIDSRGVLYFANSFKILEFDGSTWRSYPINRETWILSLAADSTDRIYAGSQGEFGTFIPDRSGALRYRSLSDSLQAGMQDFTNIWKVSATREGIVFQAEERLFILANDKVRTIPPLKSFHTSFSVGRRFFVRERGSGLKELTGKGLEFVEGSSIFDTTGVFAMMQAGKNNDRIMVATREKGLWIFQNGKFSKLQAENGSFLEKAVITCGASSPDGTIALGTMMNGVILLDSTGVVRAVIDDKKGLQGSEVNQMIFDRENNLWVVLNNGISMISTSSPLSVYNDRSGIKGVINCIRRFDRRLYAGTSTGLYIQDTRQSPEYPFSRISGINFPVRSLEIADDKLLAGTDGGIFVIKGNEVHKISNEEEYALCYMPEIKTLVSGGKNNITTWSVSSFRDPKTLGSQENTDIIAICPEPVKTGGDVVVWAGMRYKGVIRLTIKRSDNSFKTVMYSQADGLPSGPVSPMRMGDLVYFATSTGLYSFTSEEVVKQSLPDSLKNNPEFSKGFFSPAKLKIKGIGSVSIISEADDRTWICSDNTPGYYLKDDSSRLVTEPFNGLETGKINVIYSDDNGICWIGSSESLIRFDTRKIKNYNTPYKALIRKVSLIGKDSAIYNGSGSTMALPSLNYTNNSLRFDFAAPFYEFPEKTKYSYILENGDHKWSQWSTEKYQEFTNLREGKYKFSVKALNVFNNESAASSFSFVILPPWYRTVYAFISYALLSLILLWVVARLYSLKLKRENIRLESIIAERTAEIVGKNLVLEQQKKEIEDSIRYARRIQAAVIPGEELCRKVFPSSFVFFRPLNIVSGDFYWTGLVGNKAIYTVADCTGHGVPGAFMSMLGIAFLNEIVNKDGIAEPDLILNNLRLKVISALQQHGASGETRDGMDIAIISVDKSTGVLEYSGAYNPLIIVRNNEITEFYGDKMPIGIYENMSDFRRQSITLREGDMLYMYSDGYEDQFGGPDGKKFKSKKLKNLLVEVSSKPVEEQREIIEKHFDEWKGDLAQVDDVVIVGISVS